MKERDKELAKQVGLKTYQEQAPGIDGMVGEWEAFGKFADLVRADAMEVATRAANESWTLLAKALVLAEREACAVLAEKTICDTHIPTGINIYGTRAAKAIRAREKT